MCSVQEFCVRLGTCQQACEAFASCEGVKVGLPSEASNRVSAYQAENFRGS